MTPRKRELPAIGDCFGKLVVIAIPEDTRIFHGKWTCRCACGGITQVKASSLFGGTKSCGCGVGRPTAHKLPNIGDVLGHWTVMQAPDPPRATSKWVCRCVCGTIRAVAGKNLLRGGSKSCGCISLKKTTDHHRIRHSAKVSWKSLFRRVARGEAVMNDGWSDFEVFFTCLGERPEGMLLSRRNFDGPYTTDNCFWEPRDAQILRLRNHSRALRQSLATKDGTTKRCTKCRVEKSTNDFYVNRATKDRRHACCKECAKAQMRNSVLASPAKDMIARAKTRARDKGFEFALIPKDLEPLPTHCPIFGIELTRGNGQQSPSAYSLDRIDNTKGYARGNVVVMSYLANRLKNDGTAAQHARIAQWMRKRGDASSLSTTDGISMGFLL